MTDLPADKLAFTIDEAAKAISVSRETIYRRIKAGDLTAVKLGARTLVRRAALEAMLDRAEAAQTALIRQVA